jgi:hypothetical protein
MRKSALVRIAAGAALSLAGFAVTPVKASTVEFDFSSANISADIIISYSGGVATGATGRLPTQADLLDLVQCYLRRRLRRISLVLPPMQMELTRPFLAGAIGGQLFGTQKGLPKNSC